VVLSAGLALLASSAVLLPATLRVLHGLERACRGPATAGGWLMSRGCQCAGSVGTTVSGG
jgi:hypothetical protein